MRRDAFAGEPEAAATATASSKLGVQESHYAAIRSFCDETLRTHLGPGAEDSWFKIRGKALQGEHFHRYLQALRTVEWLMGALLETVPVSARAAEMIKGACATLVTQAQGYLNQHGGGFSSDAEQKFRIVSDGLNAARKISLAMDILMIGKPTARHSWDGAIQARVAGMRAAISFMTGYKKAHDFRSDGDRRVSQAYWIESAAPDGVGLCKDFIFKPMRGDRPHLRGDLRGAGPVKEALVYGMAVRFEQQTGIGLGVPETHITSIAAHALDLKGADADGKPRIGSLQAYVPSNGTLHKQPEKTFKRISPDACQRIAIRNCMTLDLDPNAENLLLTETRSDGTIGLVPIDSNDTLPSREDFRILQRRSSGVLYDYESRKVILHNPLLKMPAAYSRFDSDKVAGLKTLDPEGIVQGLLHDLETMDAEHSGLDAQTRIDADRLLMCKRSMQFLRIAAAELSPAAIQIAIGRWGEALFGASDDHLHEVVSAVIADIKPKMDAYKTFLSADPQWQGKAFGILFQHGLWKPGQRLDGWVMDDPSRALDLLRESLSNERR